jgi:RNA polymerase sigma factor (sigma-70 family)
LSTDASLPTTAPVRALGRPRPRRRFSRGRSDDALVDRVRAGDERAFELVFDRYHRSLLAFCRHMLASTEEAEDALQHTFMAAYRSLRSSDRPIRLKPWLYTIARNRCLSVLRARREQVALDDGHAASDGLAADIDRRAELRGLLADLEQLPEEQRAALVLFELGDQSHDDIAEVLGVRREKVKSLVFQARESLAGWRRARETPCVEIREQLATARGAALKRATLRRHLARCEGCAEFAADVRHQRAAMALLLPVMPAAGLKAAVLAAAGVGAGGSSLAGLGGAAKGVAAKTLMCAAVAGSAGSAGYVAVHEVQLYDGRGLHHATAAHAPHHARARASKAAKPIATARAAAPVVVAAAATGTPAKPAVASGDRARRGKHGRHGNRADWTRGSDRGRGGREQRRDGSWPGHSRDGEGRRGGSTRRDRSAQRAGSTPRVRSAQRDGSTQRDRSAQRDGSAQRSGSAGRDRSTQRGDSTKRALSTQRRGSARRDRSAQRGDSTPRDRSPGGGKRIRSGARGGSRPGTED